MATRQQRQHINIVVIGHVDAGKSTITAHLVHKCGGIPQRTLDRFKIKQTELGRTYWYEWMLYKSKEEENRGLTIEISLLEFQTAKYHCTIIDAPGHRDFIKNMISGTFQADCAFLVVGLPDQEYEAGMLDGQTRQHVLLAFTLGVKQLIVCLNKIDEKSVTYSQKRYNEVKGEIFKYVQKVGYKPDSVIFVPTSGWLGDNIVEKSAKASWYDGPTLLEAVDLIKAPKQRPTEGPLRLPIRNVYKIGGVGTVAVGRVDSGVLKPGMNVCFAPSGIKCEVKSIQRHHKEVLEGRPGDIVGFCIKGVSVRDLKKGFVCGGLEDAPKEVQEFVARIIVLKGTIQPGYTPVVYCHTAQVACRFAEIQARLSKDGSVVEKQPKSIKKGDWALVVMRPLQPMCCEPFKSFPSLGRLAIRDQRQTVAVGIVINIKHKE